MVVSRAQLLLICFLAALPALIRVGVGLKARIAPRKIAVEAIPALDLPMYALAISLPISRAAGAGLFAIGVLFGSWGVFNSVLSWRRSKAAAAPRDE
jgi:hypothetical protein